MSTSVEEIKTRLDIVDIVSDTVQLRRSGRHYSGFCPFHDNTNTPAFAVFPETQTWKCFGACNDGGDIFSFVMKKNGWDFREALKQLARRAGVQLQELTPEQKAKKEAKKDLSDLLDAAADYFHQLFLYAPQAEEAREYVRGRGLSTETIETFKIGFALDAWDACRNHFTGQGYTVQEMLDAGLMTENVERGTKYDRFRNRLMIPIWDANGRMVGFGARTLDPDGVPKYLNSPQTDLFDKSALLYGLDKAKRYVRDSRQAVIVEGYMDVIQAWQHGFRNVLAQMGTALTKEQLSLLKRYTKRFIIALDADAAGVNATMRSLEVARKTLDRDPEFRFDPTGLIRQEERLKADIRVVTMPEGEDPDSIIRADKEQWRTLIDKAQPVVAYVMQVLVGEFDVTDAKGKTAVAQKIIPLIEDITNPVEREHYWQMLGRLLQTDVRALRQLYVEQDDKSVILPYKKQKPQKKQRPSSQPPPPPRYDSEQAGPIRTRATAVRKREEHFLRECLSAPMLIRDVNRRLSRLGLTIMHAEDFSRADDRTLFLWLNGRQSTGDAASTSDAWAQLDEVLRRRIDQLTQQPPTAVEYRKRLVDQLVSAVIEWRADKINDLIDEMKVLIRQAKREEDTGMIQLHMRQSIELTRSLHQLSKAKKGLYELDRRP